MLQQSQISLWVVSWVNYDTANISKYADFQLQPLVREIPQRHTQDFLKMLQKIEGIPQESLLVNFEVKHIYLCIKEMSLLYLRYTDGIFMIRKNTKTELMTFIKELNEKHNTIKFDFQISPRKIAFLDAMLYKVENSNIQTTLYRKLIDQQALLQAKSEHPSL